MLVNGPVTAEMTMISPVPSTISVDDVDVVSVTRDGTAFAALSLWGEPLSTTYLTDLDCVVQWRWAANEGELLNDLRSAWEELEWTLIGAVGGTGQGKDV
jgi:hypothetical protein